MSCSGQSALRGDSPVTFITQSKMRRLNDARREWEQNHSPGSPFKPEKFKQLSSQSMMSAGGGSQNNSPMHCNDVSPTEYASGQVISFQGNAVPAKVFNWSPSKSGGSNNGSQCSNNSAQSIEKSAGPSEVPTKSTFNR